MPPIVPTCRYGHGPLQELPGLWKVPQVVVVQPSADDPGGDRYAQETGSSFLFKLFACRTCGAVEHFDDEAIE